MEYEAKIFRHDTFGSLRVVVIDDAPWFVGKDVATALGYKNPQKAIREHVDSRDQRREHLFTPGGVQKTVLINKSGVYSLILDSQLPKAKEYRHWVTSEVLPQVDETGSYSPVTPAVAASAPVVEQPTDIYRVYLFLLSDGNVKIGFTKRFLVRISEVKRETGLSVTGIYFTPEMPYKNARIIERCCKEVHSDQRVKDEIYSAAFAAMRASIEDYTFMAFATLPNQIVNIIAEKKLN